MLLLAFIYSLLGYGYSIIKSLKFTEKMEELRKHLGTYMSQDPDLVGIILSDREGVPLLRVTTPECPDSVSRYRIHHDTKEISISNNIPGSASCQALLALVRRLEVSWVLAETTLL